MILVMFWGVLEKLVYTGSGISFDVSENTLSTLPYKRQRFFLMLNIFLRTQMHVQMQLDNVHAGNQVVGCMRTDLRQCPFELRLQVAEVNCRLL